MSEKKLILQSSPHLREQDSVRKVMMTVVLALAPAMAASVWFFGWRALLVQVVAVVACLAFEALGLLLLKRPMKEHITDGSAVVTGLLLAMNLPSSIPIWMTVVGSAVAILVAKIPYGGIGNNPFNPALVGRVFMFVAFPTAMTSWPKPIEGALDLFVNAETGATPLGMLKYVQKGTEGFSMSGAMPGSTADMLLGNVGGCIGEISAAALLLGGLFMLWRKVITWHIPVAFIGSVFVFSGIFYLVDPAHYANPLFHVLSGGVMLGAIFMATDMVTSPVTTKGMIIFGLGCGIITCLIRLLASFPEGVSFAILIMNGLTPLIDRYIKPAPFAKA